MWYFILDYFYNYIIGGIFVGSLSMAMQEANFWFTTVITVAICIMPVLAWRFYFVDVFPSLSDRVRLKQRMAQMRSRQSQDVLRTPSARRTRRSIRSGYAFAHQEGFGRLITSGKIMRKLPNPDFNFGLGKFTEKKAAAGAPTNTNVNASSASESNASVGRAPVQDLDTINL